MRYGPFQIVFTLDTDRHRIIRKIVLAVELVFRENPKYYVTPWSTYPSILVPTPTEEVDLYATQKEAENAYYDRLGCDCTTIE